MKRLLLIIKYRRGSELKEFVSKIEIPDEDISEMTKFFIEKFISFEPMVEISSISTDLI